MIPDLPAPDPAPEPALKRKKKKDRLRTAWISFVGRIVAQVIGAIASVVLGLIVLNKYNNRDASPAAPVADHLAQHRQARSSGELAIAVLPLQNYSADTRHAYFADGITEALITDLAQIHGLRVTSRTSSMAYKGTTKSVPEIARELGVDLILEGSVVRDEGRVRVTAQLLDADTDQHLWAKSYDRAVRDVLSLQSEVATAIAKEINVAISPRLAERFASRGSIDPAVYDLYLEGMRAWRTRTPEGLTTAVTRLTDVTAREPSFAPAHAGLADTYALLWLPALELDHGSSATTLMLAWILLAAGTPQEALGALEPLSPSASDIDQRLAGIAVAQARLRHPAAASARTALLARPSVPDDA